MTARRWRRIALATTLPILLLLAADTAAWWWLTGRLLDETASWQAQRNAEGYNVTLGPATRGGWPFLAAATMPDVTAATYPAGSASWHADGVRLEYTPLDPHIVSVFLLGTQTVQAQGEPPVTLSAHRIDLRVPLDPAGEAAGLRLDARDVSLPMGASALVVQSLSARLDGVAADIVAAGVTLPGPALPFGGALDRFELQARSSIPLPPLRDPAQAAATWQQAGGRLEVSHAVLRWGPLDGTAFGTITLTPALQPAGTATLQLAGYADAADALVRAGAVNRNQARVVTAVLGLMARRNAAGVSEAEVPLTLADSVLRLGAMPLARVPPIAWP